MYPQHLLVWQVVIELELIFSMDEIGDLCNLECHSALYTLRVTSWSWKSFRIYTASQLLVGIEAATPLQHILKTHLHINKRHMRINIGTVTPLLSPKKLFKSHYTYIYIAVTSYC